MVFASFNIFLLLFFCFFFQAEDGIRDYKVTGVQTCALPILKVLDEHLPLAIDILTDLVSNPTFTSEDIEKEQKVVLEEIKMVEDTPDDLVHEIFAEGFWSGHPLGRPILGTPPSVSALDQATLRRYFADAYVARNFVVVAVGNLEHDRVKALIEEAFAAAPTTGSPIAEHPP